MNTLKKQIEKLIGNEFEILEMHTMTPQMLEEYIKTRDDNLLKVNTLIITHKKNNIKNNFTLIITFEKNRIVGNYIITLNGNRITKITTLKPNQVLNFIKTITSAYIKNIKSNKIGILNI